MRKLRLVKSDKAPGPAREPACPWTLRIELLDVKPAVWRRLVVPSDVRLPVLHQAFQAAFGWENRHLHEFHIDGVRYAEPDPHGIDEGPRVDERPILLAEAIRGRARVFEYGYDFGDGWEHAVVLEQIWSRPRSLVKFRCIGGENACPPEDVGGPPGYDDFRAAIADPRHEAHDDLLTWCGGRFDPTRFDVRAVNRALGKL